MYLLAIKSFVSWVNEVKVVVHSDGTLSSDDFAAVARHVTGVRFVRFDEADVHARRALADFPFLLRWRSVDAAYRRLIDIELWRTASRAIILDSDVLTNRRPDEVMQWIENGTRPFMLGQPPDDKTRMEGPRSTDHVQAHFLRMVPEISERLGVSPLFVQGGTAGFCGYFDEISLERIESALRTAVELGLPMEQWGGDQCLVIYLLSTRGGVRLPPDQYFNFEPSVRENVGEARVIHFYGTHRFEGGVYPRLAAAVVRRLQVRPQ